MKETKTIQVYPSDDIINSTIEEYGSFGWEVINNQRCQEYDGQTDGIKHYSTFNKITFSREKSSAWYDAVTQMEKEYNTLKNTRKSYKNYEPRLKELRVQGIVAAAIGFWLYMLLLVPGLIFTIARACKKSKYKKRYQKELADYNAVYPAKIKELDSKMRELRAQAEKYITEKE